MLLRSIYLNNFRNYEEAYFSFGKRIVSITGKNGSGKTNLVDAIYYLCITKSYFAATDFQNVKHDSPGFILRGIIESDTEHAIKCKLEKDKRKDFFLDEKRYDKLSDHVGLFPVIFSTPNDVELMYGGSEERRRLLDLALSQTNRLYLDRLQDYNRLLLQRNALLKKFIESRSYNPALLEAYDAKMNEPANYIHEQRRQAIAEIAPFIRETCNILSDENEKMNLRYESDLSESDMSSLLSANLDKDRMLGRTSRGIHRDDLIFQMDGNVIRKFGSQGQQKSFLIALKLGLYEWLKQKTGVKPFLILDDIFDKLDEERSARLIDLISTNDYGQIFLTDTQHDRLERILSSNEDAEFLQMKDSSVLL